MTATPQASPGVPPSSPHDAAGLRVAGGPPPAEFEPFVLPSLAPQRRPDTPSEPATIRLRVVLGRVQGSDEPLSLAHATPHWRLDTRDTDPIELWRDNKRVAVGWLHRIDGKLAIRVTRVGSEADAVQRDIFLAPSLPGASLPGASFSGANSPGASLRTADRSAAEPSRQAEAT